MEEVLDKLVVEHTLGADLKICPTMIMCRRDGAMVWIGDGQRSRLENVTSVESLDISLGCAEFGQEGEP